MLPVGAVGGSGDKLRGGTGGGESAPSDGGIPPPPGATRFCGNAASCKGEGEDNQRYLIDIMSLVPNFAGHEGKNSNLGKAVLLRSVKSVLDGAVWSPEGGSEGQLGSV